MDLEYTGIYILILKMFILAIFWHVDSEAQTMAMHNLVTQQLQLTRNLIDTARSLHHSRALAICPNYHYTTLEDTKQVCLLCVCVISVQCM